MSSEPVIELNNVWKKYSLRQIFHRSMREDILNFFKSSDNDLKQDEFWALNDVNLHIGHSQCVGLYGPNGAGKTTILKLIASITYPSRGDVIVRGKVAPLIEVGAGFHPDLTGRENIYVNGTIIGMSLKEVKGKVNEIIKFSEIEDFIDMPVKKYSSGMYLRLGVSVAVHSSADVLLFDEILSVSDTHFQKKCINRIKELKGHGRAMIFVSHNIDLLREVSDRICFLNKGSIVESPEINTEPEIDENHEAINDKYWENSYE